MKKINCHESNVFLIKFRYAGTQSTFILQGADAFLNCLKNNDKHGMEYIKVFDMQKNTFKRVSRTAIKSQFSFDTELSLYLENHYYFN
jgi:hypothetical protein